MLADAATIMQYLQSQGMYLPEGINKVFLFQLFTGNKKALSLGAVVKLPFTVASFPYINGRKLYELLSGHPQCLAFLPDSQ